MRRGPGHGFSLVEVVLVLSLLGLAALVVVPAAQPGRDLALESAAGEVADAMRFARSEALRTGEPHGFRTVASPDRIQVYRVDPGTNPPTPIYDVRHPLTRRPYDVALADLAKGATLTRTTTWTGTCNAPTYVNFDAEGSPRCGDPMAVLLETGRLTLSQGGASRDVVLRGPVGRVVAP